MPMYEYACPVCGVRTELLRRFSERDTEAVCEACGSEARRALSAFAVGGAGGSTGGVASSSSACFSGG